MVNRAAGKGYENEAFYENIKFQFMGIGNIHVMRKSLQKLVESEYMVFFLFLSIPLRFEEKHRRETWAFVTLAQCTKHNLLIANHFMAV